MYRSKILEAPWPTSPDHPNELVPRVLEFTEDGDLIDLSPIDAKARKRGNQEFSFIGDDGFGKKAGELKYVGGKLKGDVDGDERPDFIIKLEGSPTLTGGDFLL